MPSLNYPELQNVPVQCVSIRPWNFDVVRVRAPYQNIDQAEVELRPIIDVEWPSAQYDLFAGDDGYDQDVIGQLGYDSGHERDAINALRSKASQAVTNTAVYAPQVKDQIVALAQKAKDLFNEVYAIYATYAPGGNVTYPLKSGPIMAAFPLSVPESQMEQQIDIEKAGIFAAGRHTARKNIRAKLHKAIHLLWCALYGRAQSEAWKQNKAIYDSIPKGGTFTARPKTPPPGPVIVTPVPTPIPPGPEGAGGPTPPIPTPTPEPVKVGMPTASKVMLGGAAALALVAGVRRMFFAPSPAPR